MDFLEGEVVPALRSPIVEESPVRQSMASSLRKQSSSEGFFIGSSFQQSRISSMMLLKGRNTRKGTYIWSWPSFWYFWTWIC